MIIGFDGNCRVAYTYFFLSACFFWRLYSNVPSGSLASLLISIKYQICCDITSIYLKVLFGVRHCEQFAELRGNLNTNVEGPALAGLISHEPQATSDGVNCRFTRCRPPFYLDGMDCLWYAKRTWQELFLGEHIRLWTRYVNQNCSSKDKNSWTFENKFDILVA
ncbi:hypothetical protein ES703_81947 [subsurface metagenome]